MCPKKPRLLLQCRTLPHITTRCRDCEILQDPQTNRRDFAFDFQAVKRRLWQRCLRAPGWFCCCCCGKPLSRLSSSCNWSGVKPIGCRLPYTYPLRKCHVNPRDFPACVIRFLLYNIPHVALSFLVWCQEEYPWVSNNRVNRALSAQNRTPDIPVL